MTGVGGSLKKDGSVSFAAEIRAVLDAYGHRESDDTQLARDLEELCKINADVVWEVLSFLDQYHRRGVLSDEVFRTLKALASRIAFGPTAAKPRQPAAPVEALTQPPTSPPQTAAPGTPNTGMPFRSASVADDPPARTTQRPVPAAHVAEPAAREARAGAAATDLPQQPFDAHEAALRHSLVPGRVLHDRYMLEFALAFGRRTAVFKARDQFRVNEADRPVAVKVLLQDSAPQALEHFEHELRTAQSLAHPQLVKVFDLDRDGDLAFYSMELADGRPLGQLLQTSPPTPQAVGALLEQIAEALAYLHDRNVVHGDLHPDNVLVSAAGAVKLLDFGAAAEHGASKPWLSSQAALDTSNPLYASCERLDGLAADKRDDIFSLSCLAYRLLCLVHPFAGQLATQARDAGRMPERSALLTTAQWNAIRRGLSWQRAQRPSSARVWLDEFRGTTADTPTWGHAPARAAADPPMVVAHHATPVSAARITADTRIGPLPHASQRPSTVDRNSGSWWPTVIIVSLAALGLAFLRFDFASIGAPQLAQMQAAANEAIDKRLDALRQIQSKPDTPSATLPSATPDSSDLAAAVPATRVAPQDSTPALAADTPETAAETPVDVTSNTAAVGEQAKEAAVDNSLTAATKPAAEETVVRAPGRITFAQETFTVNKRDGAARIKIRREGGAGGMVSFVWWAEPGTAEAGKDFMSLGRKTETLQNGEREVTVFVPLVVGSDNLNRHVFFVELADPAHGLRYGRITRARVVIMDE